MKRNYCLVMFCLLTVLFTGCKDKNYQIVASGHSREALLLNQTTGESWRLTEAGWMPIPTLPKALGKNDEPLVQQAKAELARRKQIYSLLAESEEAKKIVGELKLGTIKQSEARVSLQKLIPQSLGPLPPDAEKGLKWDQAASGDADR